MPIADAKCLTHLNRSIQDQPHLQNTIDAEQSTDNTKVINNDQVKSKPFWFQLPRFCTKTMPSTLCLPVVANSNENKENKYEWYKNSDKSTTLRANSNQLLPLIPKNEAENRLDLKKKQQRLSNIYII